MPDRQIAFIRLHETHEGDALIRADRKRIKITTELLNGVVPGFRVDYGSGLERFVPASNVMLAELEHPQTDETLQRVDGLKMLQSELRQTRTNIKKTTVSDLKDQIAKAQEQIKPAVALVEQLPKEGQIAKDRKALKDACETVTKLGKDLESLIPAAEERPQADGEDQPEPEPRRRGRPPKVR